MSSFHVQLQLLTQEALVIASAYMSEGDNERARKKANSVYVPSAECRSLRAVAQTPWRIYHALFWTLGGAARA